MQAASQGPQPTPAPHMQHGPCHAGFTPMRVGMPLKHCVQCQLRCAAEQSLQVGSIAQLTPPRGSTMSSVNIQLTTRLTSVSRAVAMLNGAQLQCT